MKSRVYFLLVLGFAAVLISCSDKPNRPSPVLNQSQIDAANARAAAEANNGAAATPAAEPPQNTAGVWHYTCPNGHTGGAGSAAPCAVCGTTLVHNTAYHNTSAPATPVGATTTAGNATTIPPTTITPPVNQTPEPPQNAAGVWHYTCANGCAGGAGSATACAVCGSTLAHNTAYHN